MILTKNSQGYLPVVKNGVIDAFFSFPDAAIDTYLVTPLNAKGYNLPSSGWLEEITTLNVGDSIPNWDSYELL